MTMLPQLVLQAAHERGTTVIRDTLKINDATAVAAATNVSERNWHSTQSSDEMSV